MQKKAENFFLDFFLYEFHTYKSQKSNIHSKWILGMHKQGA